MENTKRHFFIPVNDLPEYDDEMLRISEQVSNQSVDKDSDPEIQAPPEFTWGFLFFMPGPSTHSDGNRLYFHGPIYEDSVESLKQTLVSVGKEVLPKYIELGITDINEMEIKLYINSPGGSIPNGFDLIDFMDSFHIPITTIGTGTIASMATLLLVSGKKRYVTRNSHLLVHQFRAGFNGKREEILDYLKHLEDIQQQLISYLAEHTNMNEHQVSRLLKNESWLTPEQALEMGFVDGII